VTAPWQLSATALRDAYRRRALTPVEAVESLLDRIASREPAIAAFVHLDADGARAAARNAEAGMSAGRDGGPLAGVPVAIKDNIDVAGMPTTCHSRILLGQVASRDAPCVTRLREAGAIILGKTALHEFALGGPSFDLPFPPARNPWNTAHHPGGSSSGNAAGLAAGFFPLAVGTDTAGSIRHPAGACGVVGLKPTYGRIPRAGTFPLAWSLDHVGPMARTVADIALILDVLAPAVAAPPSLAGLRVGYVRHFHETDMPADPEVAAGLDNVADALSRAGAAVSTASLPPLQDYAAVSRTILCAEGWSIHAGWLRERPQDYAASTRRRLMAGAFLSAEDHVTAMRRRGQLAAATEAAFADFDVLLTASSMDPPCRIDDAAALAHTYPRQARSPFNVTGHPALVMGAALSSGGLPLAVQFVGRYGAETTVLAVAAAFERVSDFARLSPPEPA
jgi:aspartyl-tRNA(Asn)/glutamyl-tRNA(Gln) amidotransferase subunit A